MVPPPTLRGHEAAGSRAANGQTYSTKAGQETRPPVLWSPDASIEAQRLLLMLVEGAVGGSRIHRSLPPGRLDSLITATAACASARLAIFDTKVQDWNCWLKHVRDLHAADYDATIHRKFDSPTWLSAKIEQTRVIQLTVVF